MTYDYICNACKFEFQLEQPITADPEKSCPKCGKLESKRLISVGPGFLLKGTGWFKDGY